MRFNPGDGTGAVDDIHFICETDSTSYPLADMVRNYNRHYYKAVIDAVKAEGRVIFDDTNLTTIPQKTFTWVAGQKQYSFPTDLLKLAAIEVTDAAGNTTRLQEIDLSDPEFARTITDFEKVSGVPKYYDPRGDSFYVYPAPSATEVTLSDGGTIYYSREIDLITTADTTQEPTLPEPFHRIPNIGAALDWLLVNSTVDKYNRWLSQYEQLRQEMREFYSSRNKEVRPNLSPRHNQYDYL